MFSSPRFLAYIHKPSPYYLRSNLSDERRKVLLRQISDLSTRSVVTSSNPVYQRANELMKQDKIN